MTKRTIVSCAVALLALSACSSKKAASSFDANGTPTASASVAGPRLLLYTTGKRAPGGRPRTRPSSRRRAAPEKLR